MCSSDPLFLVLRILQILDFSVLLNSNPVPAFNYFEANNKKESMFRYIATIPSKDIAKNTQNVTIDRNSVFLAESSSPVHYQFDCICTDFNDYINTKTIKAEKSYVLVTLSTDDNPVTTNVVVKNMKKIISVFSTVNSNPKIQLQIGVDAKPATFPSIHAALETIRQTNDTNKQGQNAKPITVIKLSTDPFFLWIIVPYTVDQDNSPSANFLSAVRGLQVDSPEYEVYKEHFFRSVIIINYHLSFYAPFKFIKHLFKLSEFFSTVIPSKQPSKTPPPPAAKKVKSHDEDHDASPHSTKPVVFDTKWDWEEFIRKKDFKGSIAERNEKKRIEREREIRRQHPYLPQSTFQQRTPVKKPKRSKQLIDREKLVYVAQRAADASNVPVDTMDAILNELDTQISILTQYETRSTKEYEDLEMLQNHYETQIKKAKEKYENKKREYDRIHKERENKIQIKRDEKIGFDDDVDFTIELLQEEIHAVKNEIKYLNAAFGNEETAGTIEEETLEEEGVEIIEDNTEEETEEEEIIIFEEEEEEATQSEN